MRMQDCTLERLRNENLQAKLVLGMFSRLEKVYRCLKDLFIYLFAYSFTYLFMDLRAD